jgi:hypothetical protein
VREDVEAYPGELSAIDGRCRPADHHPVAGAHAQRHRRLTPRTDLMTSQTGKNIRLAFKAQGALGTLASGSGAIGLDVRPSQGLMLKFAQAASQLIRRDGMSVKPRQGSKSVAGTYSTELIVDALDEILEGVLRGTWAAAINVTESTLTSCTITGSGATLTFAAGSLISAGARVGMMAKLVSMATAANNGKWFPILAISADGRTVTTKSGILTDETADSAFTITLARTLIQGDPPTERYFTIEEYFQDIDLSKVAQDCKFHTLNFSAAPDQPIEIGFDVAGRDLDVFASGSSPTFTSPTFVTANPLYLADGGIYINGTSYVNLTAFRFSLSMSAILQAVIGSRLAPDVALGNAIISGEFMGTIEDDSFLNLAQAETQLSVLLHCAERETDPADFISFFLGNMSMGDFSTPFGQDGLLIQSIPMVGGKDERGATAGYAPTQLLISTSAT